jgi:hypothetical protein
VPGMAALLKLHRNAKTVKFQNIAVCHNCPQIRRLLELARHMQLIT